MLFDGCDKDNVIFKPCFKKHFQFEYCKLIFLLDIQCLCVYILRKWFSLFFETRYTQGINLLKYIWYLKITNLSFADEATFRENKEILPLQQIFPV